MASLVAVFAVAIGVAPPPVLAQAGAAAAARTGVTVRGDEPGGTAVADLPAVPSVKAPIAPAAVSSLAVGLRPGTDPAALLSRLQATIVDSRPVEGLAAVTVDVPTPERSAALAQLLADPDVRYAESNGEVQGTGMVAPDDPLRVSGDDEFADNRIPPAWSWTTGSSDVTVAVLDSGVTPNADLDDGRILPGHDFVNDDDDASDDQGHGTMVAATIAGEADNGVGGAGVCWQCRILPVRVLHLSSTGGTAGTYADVAAGIVWAAEHGADVINVSLAGSTESQLLREAVATATAAGSVIIAAAGDRKSTAPHYPAAIEPVIAVGGSDNIGNPLDTANTNPATDPWIDLAARGYGSRLDHQGKKTHLVGSSVATPLVSGTVALALAVDPDLTPTALGDVLRTQSQPSGKGWHGVPTLDAGKVMHALGPPDTEAPVVQDTGLPTDGTVVCRCSRTVHPTVRDNRDVTRTEIVVNGRVVTSSTDWTSKVYWWPWPKGMDGALPVTVRAYDSSGNVGEATTIVTFDTSLSATFVTPEEYAVFDQTVPVTISGDPDITTIDVMGRKIDATTSKSPWSTTVDSSTWRNGSWQSIPATITDRAGNEYQIRRYVGIDHDTPVITLNETQFPRFLHGPLWFSLNVAEEGSLVQLTLLVNNKVVDQTDWHRMFVEWPNSEQLNGTYKLTFRAVDEAGHRSEVTRTVTLDNASPDVAGTAPSGDALVRGTFTATAWGVKDAAGIKQVDLYVDDKFVGSDTTAPYSLPVNTKRRNGTMKLNWGVYDNVGNGVAIINWVIADNTAPKTKITKAPKNEAAVKGTVKVTVSATDKHGIKRVELLVNGKVAATDKKAPYVLSLNTAKQKKTMTVQVRTYDKAGNITYTTKRTWRRK